jgi:hypothetical protein
MPPKRDGRDKPVHDSFECGDRYSAKLVPQPHDAFACGFFTLNEAPIRSSTKSISEPAMKHDGAGPVDDEVVGGLRALHVELVLEAGAAAALDRDAQHRAGGLSFEDLADAPGGALADCDAFGHAASYWHLP